VASYKDNGIALTKNAHWLFDNGLWSIRDDYTVLVAARHFAEAGKSAFLLARMQGRKITLPANPSHWPAPQHLAWHRSLLGPRRLPILREALPHPVPLPAQGMKREAHVGPVALAVVDQGPVTLKAEEEFGLLRRHHGGNPQSC